MLADVRDFVAKRLKEGRSRAALELAELACNTLQRAGQYRRAAEASRSLGELFLELREDGGGAPGQFMRTNAVWLQAKAVEWRPDDPALVAPPRDRLASLDIQHVTNRSLNDLSGPGVFEGNGLAELPVGNQVLGAELGVAGADVAAVAVGDVGDDVEGV